MDSHPFDPYSLPALFLFVLVVQLLFIELGFFLGRRFGRQKVKAQVSQARALMGAGLGLLAFMLAFTFATGQSHYEARVATMVEDARLARTAYLQTDLLPPVPAERARALLHEYVRDRVHVDQLVRENRIEEIVELIHRAEGIQRDLWALALDADRQAGNDPKARGRTEAFLSSILGLIDIHEQRLEAAIMNRIPPIIWVTLYLMAALSMLVVGYQAALVGRRTPFATFTLAIAFTAVMMLITDLDRPRMSLFHIDNSVMDNVLELIDSGRPE